MLIAMHMPDHTLAPEVTIGLALATLTACAWGLLRRRDNVVVASDSHVSVTATPAMMGVVAALVFAGQMVNFAIPGHGISGHFLGTPPAPIPR